MGRRARWSISGSVSKVATSGGRRAGQQVGDGGRGPHAGVDPALEGHDQDRPVEPDAAGLAPAGLERVEVGRVASAHSASTSASARSPSRPTRGGELVDARCGRRPPAPPA